MKISSVGKCFFLCFMRSSENECFRSPGPLGYSSKFSMLGGFPGAAKVGCTRRGRTLRKDVLLPSKHLLSDFSKTLPSKNPSKNLVFTENPYKAPSENPSKKHLLSKNLLRSLLTGEKEHTPPSRDPSFLRLSPDSEVTEQKKLWCIPFSCENKGEGYTP